MVKYTQANNGYLLQFHADRIDIISVKELYLHAGFQLINTKSSLAPNHLCYYQFANHPDFAQFIVLPAIMTSGIIRFNIYCPESVLLLSNTPIASIYPVVAGYHKIKYMHVDTKNE